MRIRYVNYKKEFPGHVIKYSWFRIKKYWSGKLIHFCFLHNSIIIDLRKDFIRDMMGK